MPADRATKSCTISAARRTPCSSKYDLSVLSVRANDTHRRFRHLADGERAPVRRLPFLLRSDKMERAAGRPGCSRISRRKDSRAMTATMTDSSTKKLIDTRTEGAIGVIELNDPP